MKKIAFTAAVLPCMTVLMGCARSAKDETYYLPKGFKGPVIVIFNQKNAAPLEEQAGTMFYKIPKSGILLTRNGPNRGMIGTMKFYYVDSLANVTDSLPYFNPTDWKRTTLPKTANVVCAMESGKSYLDTVPTEFETFLVTGIGDPDSVGERRGEFRASVLRSLKRSSTH